MASFGELIGVAKLVDQVTPTVKKIVKELGPLEQALNRNVGSVKETSISFAGVMAPAAAAAGAIALASKSAMSAADEFYNLSAKTGISTTALQKSQFAGIGVGISAQQIGMSVMRLQRSLGSGSDQVDSSLRKLGLTAQQLKGMLPEQQVIAITTGLSKMTNITERNAVAMSLIGRSGAALAPLGKGLEDAMKRAERLGVVLDEQLVEATDEFGDSLEELEAVMGGGDPTGSSQNTSSLHRPSSACQP